MAQIMAVYANIVIVYVRQESTLSVNLSMPGNLSTITQLMSLSLALRGHRSHLTLEPSPEFLNRTGGESDLTFYSKKISHYIQCFRLRANFHSTAQQPF